MPQISITTPIDGKDASKALACFDLNLFKALSPSFPKLTIARFDGSKPGDMVDIKLSFVLFQLRWLSKITSESISQEESYFIDEGITLPFFLKTWHHKHIVKLENGQLFIIDEINYSSPFSILGYLVYPMMYAQFAARKRIYKNYFSKLNGLV